MVEEKEYSLPLATREKKMKIELAYLVGVKGADVMFIRAVTTHTAMGNGPMCLIVSSLEGTPTVSSHHLASMVA